MIRRLFYIVISLIIIASLFGVSRVSASSSTYYLSPTGSDSNSGTSNFPWLTPNHALNCGDTILASPGNYSAYRFGDGLWGNVTCPAGNDVAWLKCSTFDGCKIVSTSNDAIRISSSYWGVQGWEASNSTGSCFSATPHNGTTPIHHVIFANDIANGCKNGGFNTYPFYSGTAPASVDYVAFIGNLVYNSASGNTECFSGISVYEPRNLDTLPGTHIYVGQNITWSNVDASNCPGESDGEGIILDDFNGDQSGYSTGYAGQTVVENNISLGNGSSGIRPYHNSTSPTLIRFNTAFGNNTDIHSLQYDQGEIQLSRSSNVTIQYNIADAVASTGGSYNSPIYALFTLLSDGTNVFDYNWGWSSFGHNSHVDGGSGFVFGTHNTFGVNPGFANPFIPLAPVCNGTANTLDCMKNVISGFVPSAVGISNYGYQSVNSNYVSNPYYPTWLCNVTMPIGIISNYCTIPATNTPTMTNTATFTPTNTETFIPTSTSTFTATFTSTYTSTPTSTYTNTPTLTPTSTSTFTPTDTMTPTITYTPTLTDGNRISTLEVEVNRLNNIIDQIKQLLQ